MTQDFIDMTYFERLLAEIIYHSWVTLPPHLKIIYNNRKKFTDERGNLRIAIWTRYINVNKDAFNNPGNYTFERRQSVNL